MQAVRFIHCADLHIDTPFKGLSEVHPELREILYQSTYRSFQNIIDLAIREEVDCVLIAGDIFDSANKSLHAQIKFRNGLKRISDAGIPSFVVYGNHDPLDSWSASLEWPELVTIFGGEGVTHHPLIKEGRVIARIFGISFSERAITDNLSLQFENNDHEAPAIGLLHTNVGKNTGHEPYAPASIKDLSSRGMDYWALGHVHNHLILKESHPAIVYPGNSQATNPRETGPRGCCLVTLYPDGSCQTRFVPTDVVRYISDHLDISQASTHDDVINAIKERCEGIAEGMDRRHAVIRLSLTGRTDLHGELQKGNNVTALLGDVREHFEGRDPWIWIERLVLKTAGHYDVDALRQGNNFLSDIISLYDELADEKSELWPEIRRALTPLFTHWQGRRHLEELSMDELLKIAEEARNRTLDMMVKDT